MKIQTLICQVLLLIASVASVFAQDNPSQAAARAALVKKLFELDRGAPHSHSTWDASVATNPLATVSRAVAPVVTNPKASAGIPAETNSLPSIPQSVPPAAAPVHRVPSIAVTSTNPPSSMLSLPAPVPKTSAPTAANPGPDLAGSGTKPVITRAPLPSRSYLETVHGTIYHNVVVERVETNAIVISYVPANGGSAMVRLYFDELTPDTREQYKAGGH